MTSGGLIPISEAQWRVEKLPAESLRLPVEGASFILDSGVVEGMSKSLRLPVISNTYSEAAVPDDGVKVVKVTAFGHSIGSFTAKIEAERPNGGTVKYFLKAC